MPPKKHLPIDLPRLRQRRERLLVPRARELVDTDHLAPLARAEDVEEDAFVLAFAWALGFGLGLGGANAEGGPFVFDEGLFYPSITIVTVDGGDE